MIKVYTQKQLEKLIDNEIKKRVEKAKSYEIKNGIYLYDVIKENERLKSICERQEAVLNAITTVKEFLK